MNITHESGCAKCPTPFGSTALQLFDLGLHPIPVEGKKPAIKAWQQPRSRQTVETLTKKFDNANVGILTGDPSGITALDIDDPDLIEPMLSRFGSTPLINATPSGGADGR